MVDPLITAKRPDGRTGRLFHPIHRRGNYSLQQGIYDTTPVVVVVVVVVVGEMGLRLILIVHTYTNRHKNKGVQT